MYKLNEKRFASDEYLKRSIVGSIDFREKTNSHQLVSFYKKLIDIAYKFDRNPYDLVKEPKKNITQMKVYSHSNEKYGLESLHYEMFYRGGITSYKTVVYTHVLLGDLAENKMLKNRKLRFIPFVLGFTGFVIKAFLPMMLNKKEGSEGAALAVIGASAFSVFLIFDLLRNIVKIKKLNNTLLMLTSLEQGILAAEKTERAVKKLKSSKKTN